MFGIWLYFITPNNAIAVIVSPPYVAYVNPTGITDIALDKENIQINIKNKHDRVGASREKPFEILAKLLALIPVAIAKIKKIYPEIKFTDKP